MNPNKNRGEHRCSTSGTRHATFVTKPVIIDLYLVLSFIISFGTVMGIMFALIVVDRNTFLLINIFHGINRCSAIYVIFANFHILPNFHSCLCKIEVRWITLL